MAALVAVMIVMLFVGEPEAGDSRFMQAVWNLGHVPLFAGLACAAPLARALSTLRLLIACTLLAVLVGIAIEWLQLLFGRSFDYMDVLRNLAGVYLGLSVHLVWRSRSWPQRLGYSGLGGLLLLALLPMGLAMVDSQAMQRVFSDFESTLELSRWETQRAVLSFANEPVRQGRQSLRVAFLPGRFPDVSLRELQSDCVLTKACMSVCLIP